MDGTIQQKAVVTTKIFIVATRWAPKKKKKTTDKPVLTTENFLLGSSKGSHRNLALWLVRNKRQACSQATGGINTNCWEHRRRRMQRKKISTAPVIHNKWLRSPCRRFRVVGFRELPPTSCQDIDSELLNDRYYWTPLKYSWRGGRSYSHTSPLLRK